MENILLNFPILRNSLRAKELSDITNKIKIVGDGPRIALDQSSSHVALLVFPIELRKFQLEKELFFIKLITSLQIILYFIQILIFIALFNMLKVKYIQIVIPVKFGLEGRFCGQQPKLIKRMKILKIYKNMFFGVNTAMRL